MAYVTNLSLVDACHVVGMVHCTDTGYLSVPHRLSVDVKQVEGITAVCLLTKAGFLAFPRFVSVTKYECYISGFRLEVDKNSALLGYYAACNGNSLPTFRRKISIRSWF